MLSTADTLSRECTARWGVCLTGAGQTGHAGWEDPPALVGGEDTRSDLADKLNPESMYPLCTCNHALPKLPDGLYGSRLTDLTAHRHLIVIGVVIASLTMGQEVDESEYMKLSYGTTLVNDLVDFRSDTMQTTRELGVREHTANKPYKYDGLEDRYSQLLIALEPYGSLMREMWDIVLEPDHGSPCAGILRLPAGESIIRLMNKRSVSLSASCSDGYSDITTPNDSQPYVNCSACHTPERHAHIAHLQPSYYLQSIQ